VTNYYGHRKENMRGYMSEEYGVGKCTVCGKNGLLMNGKCPKCHDIAVWKIFKRMFTPFIEENLELLEDEK